MPHQAALGLGRRDEDWRSLSLKIGLGHAVGAALHVVLRALPGQAAAWLLAPAQAAHCRQGSGTAELGMHKGSPAGYRQLHAGNSVRGTRRGLNSKCQKMHKSRE